MIDTLMALWNQDRRKRAGQVILTFFLLCIGISLLFVIMNMSAASQHQQTSVGQGSPTVPTFGNTVIPDITPTMSIVVGTQPTPGAKTMQPTPVVTIIQPTPIAMTTQPCVGTPSSATSHTSSLYVNALIRQTSSPTPAPRHDRRTPSVPIKHFDGGGGPIDTGTAVLPTPTAVPQNTPSIGSQPGWVPNCTTSTSIGIIARSDVLAVLLQNMWLILGSSLLGTVIFYGTLFAMRRILTIGS